MRVLIFHGYLLRGTGSNVYNASLARALLAEGHEVHLFCQDRRAGEEPWVDAVVRWRDGRMERRLVREPVRCTAYLPDIGGVLPTYVADAYEGFDARPFSALSDGEVGRYLEANVAAVAETAALVAPEAALANHLVMGPAVLARGLGDGAPYAVKIHGSALEYTVRPEPERFLGHAREGLAGARSVLVGSRHIAERLWETMADPELPARTRLGPPGVDAAAFRRRPGTEARAALDGLRVRLARPAAGWGGEAGAADAVAAIEPGRDALVVFVGKLIVSKGIDLLLAAWPLVVERVPAARLVVVGFGELRQAAGELVDGLARGELAPLEALADRGRELEGGPPGRLEVLAAFLAGLQGDRRERYRRAGVAAAARIHFTGRLEHEDLPALLGLAEAQVVPSTFPEAFGMVAAEGAAAGALPVSAAHSGLAEVTRALAPALAPELRPLLSFTVAPGAVEALADRLATWLERPEGERRSAGAALAEVAERRYGWGQVARTVLAASAGRLDELPMP